MGLEGTFENKLSKISIPNFMAICGNKNMYLYTQIPNTTPRQKSKYTIILSEFPRKRRRGKGTRNNESQP